MKLSINSAEYYAYHGVKAEEQSIGGKYEIDLDMYYKATEAVVNDDVNYALNYEEAMYCIDEVISSETYHLIETITNEILNLAMEKFPQMVKATCRVRKMSVPIRRVVSYIEAEQTMTRNI